MSAASLKSLLALCRVSNLPTVWMNVLTACVLSAGALGQPVVPAVVALLAAALSGFYCGGMSLNDLCDREWDAVHQPFRPIPAGRVSVGSARWVTVMLFGSGAGLLLAGPNPRGVGAAAVLLLVVALYDRFHKQHSSTVFLMAAARLLVFVVAALALTGQVAGVVWIAAAAQFGYTLLITVVARHEHVRGERYAFALIPRMIAGMAVLDGLVLAALAAPGWILAGLAAALLTLIGQRHVRGD